MTDEKYEVFMQVLGDLQLAVDALGLDVERIKDILGSWEDDDPQPPDWVNHGRGPR